MGLVLVMCLGIAVYLRLWTIDYSISSNEAEMIRKQFDLANREAMEESAEWRLKYDVEAERASNCLKELMEIKESMEGDGPTGANQKLKVLQKEREALLKEVEDLKKELEAEKLRCHSLKHQLTA